MRVLNLSKVTNQFKKIIDQVVADDKVTIITSRDADDVVLMSRDTYNRIMETLHILKSPANLKHLEKSLEQYRKGQLKTEALVDAK
jgi:antitoxin YefM